MLPCWRRIAAAVAAAWVAAVVSGCGVWVRAPELRPGEPAATVYITDYGRHSTLLLPRDDGTMTEYAFGQWEWFALGRQGTLRGPLVLLVPGRATLGVRRLEAPADAADLARRLGLAAAYEVRVDAAEAASLRRELDARFAARAGEAVHNPAFGLDFVPVDDWYWLANNCNTVLARWLGDLGCRVSGLAIVSRFSVRGAGREPAGSAFERAGPRGSGRGVWPAGFPG